MKNRKEDDGEGIMRGVLGKKYWVADSGNQGMKWKTEGHYRGDRLMWRKY